MDSDQRTLDKNDDRVVAFRPRTSARPPQSAAQRFGRYFSQAPADELSRFEHTANQPDDYRQRMAMNVAAIVFTVLLTAAGIWLALKMADLRSTQDCVLMGRRDCAHLSSPTP